MDSCQILLPCDLMCSGVPAITLRNFLIRISQDYPHRSCHRSTRRLQ